MITNYQLNSHIHFFFKLYFLDRMITREGSKNENECVNLPVYNNEPYVLFKHMFI